MQRRAPRDLRARISLRQRRTTFGSFTLKEQSIGKRRRTGPEAFVDRIADQRVASSSDVSTIVRCMESAKRSISDSETGVTGKARPHPGQAATVEHPGIALIALDEDRVAF